MDFINSNSTSCIRDRRAQCHSTGWGQLSVKQLFRKGPQGTWWTKSWMCVSSMPLQQRRSVASCAALVKAEHADPGKWSFFFSIWHLWDHIWHTASDFSLFSTRKIVTWCSKPTKLARTVFFVWRTQGSEETWLLKIPTGCPEKLWTLHP